MNPIPSSQIARITSLLVLVLASTVMLGWGLQIAAMTQIVSGYVGMVFNTALCFAVSSAALLLPTSRPVLRRRAQIGAGIFIVVLASIILSQYLFAVNLGIDFPNLHRWLIDTNPTPGRMAPNSTLGFICVGAILILLNNASGGRWTSIAIRSLFVLLLMITVSGVVAYALKPELLYPGYHYTRMAVHTAAGFFLLTVGLWCSWNRVAQAKFAQLNADARRISVAGGAILIVIALVAGLSGFAILQQQTEATLKNGLTLSLQSRVDAFQEAIRQGVSDVDFVATRPIIIDAVRRLGTAPDDKPARMQIDVALKSFLPRGFAGIALYGETGRELARVGKFIRQPQADIVLKLPSATHLLWQNGIILRVVLPLLNQGHQVGTVLAELPLPYLMTMMADVRGLGQSGEMAVCSLRGQGMLCLPIRHFPRVSNIPRVINYVALPMSHALDGHSGVIIAKDYRRQYVIAAYQPIGTLGLGMVLKMDTAELYRPIRETLEYVVPLLIGLVLLGIVLLRWQVLPLVRRLVRSEQSSRNMRLALEHAVEGVSQIDDRGRYISVNDAYAAMLAYTPGELIGRDMATLICPEDRASLLKAAELMAVEGRGEAEVRIMRKDDSMFYAQWFMVNALDEESRPVGQYCFMKDISARKNAEQALQESSLNDELTGLYNRRGFMQLAEQQLRVARRAKRPLLLFFIDMDGLKQINDQWGHVEGDVALVHVAQVLRCTFRDSDVIARLGGDEFAVIAVDIGDGKAGTAVITGRLHACIRNHNAAAGKSYQISVSVGAARFEPDSEHSIGQLIALADELMYQNKRNKRQRSAAV